MSWNDTGNLLHSSTPLDINQKWQVIENQLGFENTDDYYSLQLSNRSNFNLVLNDLSGNADVRLLNHNGSEVAISSKVGTTDERINQILDAGTYFIEVHQVDDAEIDYGLEYRNNYIPKQFQFNTETIESGVRLRDTKIVDADGVNDIHKVDVWLRKQGESWQKLGNSVSEFSSNTDNSIGFNYDISNLEQGEYDIWARATDKLGARSNGWKESFTVENIADLEVENVNVAPSNLDFGTKKISGGIELTNTKVFDANGIDDLNRVDFQLKKENGESVDINDALDFSENQDGSIGFEYSISGLEQGNYELKATAYDKPGEKSEGLKTYFQVDNVAPTQLQFEIETIVGGVTLRDTKVFDANGIDDLTKVDFWLLKEDGSSENIADAVEFRSNEHGSFSFDYTIDSLENGNYTLWARARDKANDYSNIWEESFSIANAAPSQVDFEFKEDDGEQIEIQSALNSSNNQDVSIGLEQGNDELKATADDKAGDTSNQTTTDSKADNIPPSDFTFDIEAIEGGVRVVNAKVFDGNGMDDLTRVDFWLQKPDGSWKNIADVKEFRSNVDGTIGFDYSIDSLQPGDYVLWARTRDQADTYSNVWQKSFKVDTATSQPEQDWFDRNIQDASIRTLSRSLFSDNIIDRNDAIAILRDAKDNSVVDATEINDLRTIIENASYLGMADYVRVLSEKVVNGDTANKSSNLQAGSSDVELDKLINKWFLGSDRPETSHTYQYAQGSLFQNGISHDDIRQGYINDCFFLAGLGATVVQSPEIIKNMFIDNGDGTFTVRFYNKGVADYVTVDRYLPTNNMGNFVYANPGNHHGNTNNELWVVLAEKAYAQVNESGWINQDGTNSYNGIGNAGYLSDAFAHITGEKSVLGRQLNFNTIVDTFKSGEVVGFGSKSNGVQSNIVTSHAYALVDYNASSQKFTLLNPWSTDNNAEKSRTLELSWDEISTNFSYWDSTISNPIST